MAEVNVTLDILNALLEAKPDAPFISSLHSQYCNRGGLSKKQLEGLYAKAEKSGIIPVGKLATLQAIIKKKPTRYKSEAVKTIAAPEKDEAIGKILMAILEKYPEHKRVLFLHSKYQHNDPLNATETAEIEKLGKLLIK